MPRRQKAFMPGFGDLSLGLPMAGQPIQPYQEGAGTKPPVPLAPDQALAARAGVPDVRTPEQQALGNQPQQAAAAGTPAGFVVGAPTAPPPPVPVAPAANPNIRIDWAGVTPDMMPAMLAQQKQMAQDRQAAAAAALPPALQSAVGAVQSAVGGAAGLPMAPKLAAATAAPPAPVAPAAPAGPVMDEQRGGMSIGLADLDALQSKYNSAGMSKRIGQLQTKAAAGDAAAQTELSGLLRGVKDEQQAKLTTEQSAQQVKALDAEVEGLKYAEAKAADEVKRLEAESKNRDVSQDLELAQSRLRQAQGSVADALGRKQRVLAGPGGKVQPLPVGPASKPMSGARYGAMALKEALGIDLSMGEKTPESQDAAKAAARVGPKVAGDMAESLNSAIMGKRMKVVAWDDQGNQVLKDVPDPRYPGLYKGGRLSYEDLQRAEDTLATSFGVATGGAGKQEADLALTRKAAMVAWVNQNRYRQEFQEATSEWIRKNKKDWEQFGSKIPVVMPAAAPQPAAVPGVAPAPAGPSLEQPAAPPGVMESARRVMQHMPVVGGLFKPGAPQQLPGPAVPQGNGQPAPQSVMAQVRDELQAKGLSGAQLAEAMRRRLDETGWTY